MQRPPRLTDKRLYWRGRKIWCRVPGPKGMERRTTECTDELAARAKADEFERRFADPSYRAAAEATLERGISALLQDLQRRNKSVATRKKAVQKCGHFLRLWPGCTMRDLEERGPEMVLRYIDQRLTEGVVRFTIKMELQHLGMVLKIARYLGTFYREPAELFPPFFTGGHKPRKAKLTQEQVLLLLAQLPHVRKRHVCWILATGARDHEAAVACREDVHDYHVHLWGTKTEASDDDVPITELSHPWLVIALDGAPEHGRLHEPWGNIRRDLATACRKAGVPRVTPNDLRRTFASWHRDAGVPAELVSKLLRHTTDKLAQTTYAPLSASATGSLIWAHLRGRTRVPTVYPDPTAMVSVGVQLDPHSVEESSRLLGKLADPEGAHRGIRTPDLRFTKAQVKVGPRGRIATYFGSELGTIVPDVYVSAEGGVTPRQDLLPAEASAGAGTFSHLRATASVSASDVPARETGSADKHAALVVPAPNATQAFLSPGHGRASLAVSLTTPGWALDGSWSKEVEP